MSTETDQPVTTEEERKGFRFPSAFTILFFVTIVVWLLAFVIPAGRYLVGEDGRPVPGSYEQVDSELSRADRLYELFLAPVNGLYGVESGETGFIGPYEAGEIFGAVAVFFFVLAIGAFITMTIRTGALDVGIARLSHRLRDRSLLLIVVLMVVFSLGGTTYGMAEETLGFYGLVVPLMLSLGYDRLTAAATIMIGAGVGTLASTVNPFATGVASDAAEISVGDGFPLRLLMWVGLTAVAVVFVTRYARRVHKVPERSLVGYLPGDREMVGRSVGEVPTMSAKQRAVIWVFGLTFALMVFSVIPWASVIQGSGADPYAWQLDWYFPELAALFLAAAILIGLIGGLGEKGISDGLVQGAGDFIGAALIIAIARGVTVIMNNADITDTILNSLETAVSNTSSAVFAVLMYIVNIPLAFLVPSSSGHATLAMPILAPLGDFAGVSRSLVVTAYQSASGIVNLVTPTSAVVMGGLALARVGYDKYVRFVLPLLGILFLITCGFLTLGALVGGEFA
ncbi:MAG TPA: hypothetical protein VFR74_04365 [Jiangellales bacterium]|nr:hypothetical protein [Jiangellales bacterium]